MFTGALVAFCLGSAMRERGLFNRQGMLDVEVVGWGSGSWGRG